MNYPSWVTDTSQPPDALLVPGKKLDYVFVAIEKMRHLHNGVFNWALGRPISSPEDTVLREIFHADNQWGVVYPDDQPTEAQARTWIENNWEPRHHELQSERARMRKAIPEDWFQHVDLAGIL